MDHKESEQILTRMFNENLKNYILNITSPTKFKNTIQLLDANSTELNHIFTIYTHYRERSRLIYAERVYNILKVHDNFTEPAILLVINLIENSLEQQSKTVVK